MSKARGLADLGNVFDDGALSNRNLIINGAMQVAQRGTSATGLTGSNYTTLDRWKHIQNASGMQFTATQSSDAPDTFSSSYKIECTTAQVSLSASDRCEVRYYAEAQDLQSLAYGTSTAKTMTLSFWVKSNQTGTYCIWIYAADNARSISKSYTIAAANTWEYKTITYDGDTSAAIANDNGTGVWISFFFAAGSSFTSGTQATSWEAYTPANIAADQTVNIADSTSNYINITGVQLEVGDSATPFEHRSYGDTLARCQRYYQVYGDGVTNSLPYVQYTAGNRQVHFKHHPLLRASPTVTQSHLSGATVGFIYLNKKDVFGTYVNLLGTSGSSNYASQFTFDAEL